MIDIVIQDGKLAIKLSAAHPNYLDVFKVVRGLLTARELGPNYFRIGYDDLLLLKSKLDILGFVEGRNIEYEAEKYIKWIESINKKNLSIKKGSLNNEILEKLEGKIKSVLYEDQLDAVAYAYHNRRCGIFFGMGSGKSLISLAAIVACDSIKKSLVIAPKTVLIGFHKEVYKHTYMKPLVLPAGRKKCLDYLEENKDVDWDICFVHPENLVGVGKKGQSEILQALHGINFDMIVVDEYHQYKNLEAKRTKAVLSLLNENRDRFGNYPRAILMTGTPISESPLNAYSVLKVIGHDRLPHYTVFENHFTIKQKFTVNRRKKAGEPYNFYKSKTTFNKVVGYKNLKELKMKLNRVSIHRAKHDLRGFPDKSESTRYVEMSNEEKRLYRTLCEPLIKEITPGKKVAVEDFINNKAIKLRQLLNSVKVLNDETRAALKLSGSLDGDKYESSKYLELDNLLEEILEDKDQKVVIWTEYRAAVDLLHKRYNGTYGAVKIYGGVSNDELVKISDDFENGDSVRVAICIPAKAGTGVDFLARARTAIYVDRPYSYTLYKQSLDRIHRRVKQGNDLSKLDLIRSQPASIIFLEVVGTIDEVIRDMLVEKDNVAVAVTTDTKKLEEIGREDLLKYLK
jgi:SNF2 family DNA or RNA helicase